MIEITLDEMVDMILQPWNRFWDEKCWLVDQDSGNMKQISVNQLSEQVGRLSRLLILTDDEGGNLSMVTLDIHFDMTDKDTRKGKLIRLYLCKKRTDIVNGLPPSDISSYTKT